MVITRSASNAIFSSWVIKRIVCSRLRLDNFSKSIISSPFFRSRLPVGLFYNFWNYEIESVVLEEGNWQGRISGAFEEDKVSEIENFANVKTAIINEDLSDDQTLVVDICFDNLTAVIHDTIRKFPEHLTAGR